MIAFTNHALDHMLCSVLDAEITHKIVRLGRRSNDERIAQFSIETLEMEHRYSRLNHSTNVRRELKGIEEEIKNLMVKALKVDIEDDSEEIMKYVSAFYPEHHNYFLDPPEWLDIVRSYTDGPDEGAGDWQTAGPKGKSRAQDNSNYAFWKDCRDFAFIAQATSGVDSPPMPTASDDVLASQNAFSTLAVADDEESEESESESDSDAADDMISDAEESWKRKEYKIMPTEPNLHEFDYLTSPIDYATPLLSSNSTSDTEDDPLRPEDFRDPNIFGLDQLSIPSTDRKLEELLDDVGNVWSMSPSERLRIHGYWVEGTRNELRMSSTDEFKRLRELHAQKLRESQETAAEVCLNHHILGINLSQSARFDVLYCKRLTSSAVQPQVSRLYFLTKLQ